MRILIAQASIDEKGTTVGAKNGDQTGKELNIKEYTKGFNTVIRPKESNVANNMVWVATTGACNKHIGYSQPRRNTLWKLAQVNKALANITGDCACDCSSFASVVAQIGYYSVHGEWLPKLDMSTNAPTTSNMITKLCGTGCFEWFYLTDNKQIHPGDILLKNGHCAVVIGVE